MKRVLLLLVGGFTTLFFCTSADSASSAFFEPGFYLAREDKDKYDKIGEFVAKADVDLECKTVDELWYKNRPSSNPMTRKQIQPLVKLEPNKRSLVVELICGELDGTKYFPQPLKQDAQRQRLMAKTMEQLSPFLESLDFERVLVLARGGTCLDAGYYVLADKLHSR